MARRKKKNLPDATRYQPDYVESGELPSVPDSQPGLPAIHKVQGTTKQGRGKLFGQYHEGTMKSPSLNSKIDAQLSEELTTIDYLDSRTSELLGEMLHLSSGAGFMSKSDFKQHLTEGAMFNITKLASSYIGLPAGEYIVWDITPKGAVLVPTAVAQDTFSESPVPVEVHMSQLLGAWDKVKRTISEADQPYTGHQIMQRKQASDSKYGEGPASSAIIKTPESQEDMASRCGVDPSTLSRIRHGYRRPSIDTLDCLSDVTGETMDELVKGQVKKKRGTSKKTGGSGSEKAARAAAKGGSPYSKGHNESFDKRIAALQEALDDEIGFGPASPDTSMDPHTGPEFGERDFGWNPDIADTLGSVNAPDLSTLSGDEDLDAGYDEHMGGDFNPHGPYSDEGVDYTLCPECGFAGNEEVCPDCGAPMGGNEPNWDRRSAYSQSDTADELADLDDEMDHGYDTHDFYDERGLSTGRTNAGYQHDTPWRR